MTTSLETILNIKVDGTSQMTALKEEIDKTTQELKDLKAEQKAGTGDTKKLNAQILTQETRLKAMRSEMNKAKTETIKMNSALASQGKSYNDLTKQNAALSQELRKLADPMGKNRKEFDTLSKKIRDNTNELKKMDEAMGRQQRNVGNYGGAIKGMALQIGAAIMAFKGLETAISTFSDFQFAIKQVGVISGASAQEMQLLEDQAKELGATTAFTAGEVANLQIELAKLGFDAQDIDSMTSSVLDLSFAFGEELNVTAEQVGVTLRGFNLDASEASRVTDVMAAAFSNTALDLSKFATAMPKVASVASTMGFTLEDTTSILGLLANTGMEASSAGTALRNMFLKLADPTGDLAKALGRNITSVEELIPAMQELDKKGIDVAGMLEITDKRSVTAFASMLKGSKQLGELNKVMKDSQGLTKKFADAMRDSLKGNIDATKSAAEGLVIELVDGLEPIINMLLFVFQEFLGVMRSLVPVIISVTAGFAGYSAVLAVNKARVLASQLAIKLLGTSTVTTTGIINVAKNAMLAFNTAIRSNPIGLLVGGLATAVTLFTQFSDGADEAGDELENLNNQRDRFNEIDQQANNNLATQLAEVQSLINVIGDHTKGLKERNKALDKLNEIHPTTISNMQDEKKLAGELEQAYEDIAKAMEAEILMSAAKEKVKELLIEQREEQDKIKVATDDVLETQLRLLGVANDISAEGKIIGHVWDGASGSMVENADAIQFVKDNWTDALLELRTAQSMYDDATATHNGLVLQNSEAQDRLAISEQKVADIKTKVKEILKEATDESNALTAAIVDQTDKVDDDRTAYEKLQDAVSTANKNLKEAVATNGDVAGATKKLVKAKENLAKVDTEVAKIIKENDDKNKDNTKGLKEQIAKVQEKIDADTKQLDTLKKLEKAEADITKERIEQAIKVAEAQLEMALLVADSTDKSFTDQATHINNLKNQIKGFNDELNKLSDDNSVKRPSGWLNSNLFGTGGEDGSSGEPFTGADMINSISTTLGAVMDVMDGFNELQNANSEARISNMEADKQAEIKKFKESAEFAVMTEEERTKKIEDIEEKHDDAILAEKIAMFDKNKKFLKSQAVMAGAMAIMQIWSSSGTGNVIADTILKSILTAAQIGLTAMQIATINAQQPPSAELGGIEGETFADGGMVHGRSHAQGGEKFRVGGRVVELEGGEAVINKRSTAMFKPQLSAMNVAGGGRKFADGGMTFATDVLQDQSLALGSALDNQTQQQVVLVESDVTDSQKSVENIEAQATF
tara:strand:+ start:7982 stop:11767 length:3786 start_codon:yes stop_codon:yes gene_type:complete